MARARSSPEAIRVAETEAKALELRKQGRTYEEIARQVGYADRSGAYKAVMRSVRKLSGEPAADVRALELMRLDALLAVLWPQAEAGDLKAIQTILNLMARRSRYLGLDAPPPKALPASPENLTQIVYERLIDAPADPADG